MIMTGNNNLGRGYKKKYLYIRFVITSFFPWYKRLIKNLTIQLYRIPYGDISFWIKLIY